jgi:hypothetical protein
MRVKHITLLTILGEPAAATVMQASEAPATARNAPPLSPGGAACIRKAQGTADVDVWFISGLIVAAIVAALLLADDDDESTDGTATAD